MQREQIYVGKISHDMLIFQGVVTPREQCCTLSLQLVVGSCAMVAWCVNAFVLQEPSAEQTGSLCQHLSPSNFYVSFNSHWHVSDYNSGPDCCRHSQLCTESSIQSSSRKTLPTWLLILVTMYASIFYRCNYSEQVRIVHCFSAQLLYVALFPGLSIVYFVHHCYWRQFALNVQL